jgi:molybdenum ABC transporter molybdate-binding protein
MFQPNRRGSTNGFYLALAAAVVLLAALGFVLAKLGGYGSTDATGADGGGLQLYCAAGIRAPIEKIAADYEREYGVPIQIQYGGSNTLLSQIEAGKRGDLFLAADDAYLKLAAQKGFAQETMSLAEMRPVIAVPKGNPKNIHSIDDLFRDDVRTALGNPDQAAIGKATRSLLKASGHWDKLDAQVKKSGVYKPTVPEVVNDVKLGSVDAAIVWDTTLNLYPSLEAVHVDALDAGTGKVAVSVLSFSENPTAAIRFARYASARDKGSATFKACGFQTVDGDVWAEKPQLTFFCGSVNRRAVESIIQRFEKREGVVVNTIYNGCGILTGQMRTIDGQEQSGGFPDTYMACDRYYLESVKDWFQDDVDVSDTEVVIAVPKGNPGKISTLKDLARPGLRVSVGQPDQCTIGVLTRQTLESEGVYDEVMKNVVMQTASSAMLIPTVATKSVDVTLAYATDAKAEADKVDVIRIDSAAAKAIQPFAIARTSDHKHLGRRLFEAIAESRETFEEAGFHFRLESGDRSAESVHDKNKNGAQKPTL